MWLTARTGAMRLRESFQSRASFHFGAASAPAASSASTVAIEWRRSGDRSETRYGDKPETQTVDMDIRCRYHSDLHDR